MHKKNLIEFNLLCLSQIVFEISDFSFKFSLTSIYLFVCIQI